MLKENITLAQLFTLIVNYLLGTAIVTGVGREALQDTWIAILLATVIGLGLIYFFYSFNHLLPKKNFYEILEYCLGRNVAILISISYFTYFLYILTRVLRTFGEMISSAVLVHTPFEINIFPIILVLVYIVYLGFEVIARVNEILFPYVLLLAIVLFVLLIGSGVVKLHHLQPIMGEGFKLIVKAVYPSLVTYPFGELLVFTVIFANVPELVKGKKVSLIAVGVSGVLLAISSILMVTTLGPDSTQYSGFPMLNAARRVAIGDFIERIDLFVVIIMMFGVIVKGAIYFYVGLKGIEYVFKTPYRYFSIPISMLITVFTIITSQNQAEYIFELQETTIPYLHPVMQFFIPVLIMGVLIWKTKKKSYEGAKNSTNGMES